MGLGLQVGLVAGLVVVVVMSKNSVPVPEGTGTPEEREGNSCSGGTQRDQSLRMGLLFARFELCSNTF